MSYFNQTQLTDFDPFVIYSNGEVLTREFVDYFIDLIKTDLSKAYSIFKQIKPSKKSIRVDWFEEIDIAITNAYDSLY